MTNKSLSKEQKAALEKLKLIELSERSVEAIHQGPLPHPKTLQGYEDILKGSAERILKMAEQQAEHRRTMEKDSLSADMEVRRKFTEIAVSKHRDISRLNRLGLWLGWTLAIGCFTASVLSMMNDKDWKFSAIFLSVVISNLIRTFARPYDASEKQE